MVEFIFWIILGLIAGAIAKWIMPGTQGGGIIMTIILGIVGALVGGFVATLIPFLRVPNGINFGSIVTSVIGALIVLWIYGLVTKKRA